MKDKPILIAVAALVTASGCSLGAAAGRAAGPMPNDAYIWQRAWTEAVTDAVLEHGTNFTELIALNADVSWRNRLPQVMRVPLDFDVLRQSGRRIGLALRIGSYSGPFN